MNKTLTLSLFIFLYSASFLFSQDVIEIGGETWEWENSYTSPISIDANYDNSNSHYISIYSADEIGSSAFIDGLSWYKTANSPGYFGGDAELKIYFKHTSLDSIPTELGTFNDELVGANLVYNSNTVSIPLIGLWINHVLDTGFAFNGLDNLMILVEWYMPGESTEGPGLGLFYGNYTNGKGAMWRGNSFDNLEYFTSSSSADRPIIKFNTAAANDVGLNSSNIPDNWDGESPFDIEFYNAGSELLESFTIKTWINGEEQNDYLWSGTLGQNDTSIISFESSVLASGLYHFSMVSELPNGEVDGDPTNDSLQFFAYSCDGSLSGTYTVGENGDFTSLLEISYALNTCGINGDVNFSFLPGVYEGQLSLDSISGSSVNDSIFFFSENGNSSSVIWEYASEDDFDNWVVNLNRSSYISFKDLTLHASGTFERSRLLVIHNGTNNINVESCQLIGFDHNSFCGGIGCGENDAIYISTVDGNLISDITIIDNFFKYNASAIYVSGNENQLLQSLYVEDNILRDTYRYGFYVEWADAPVIKDNHIRTANTYSYAIEGIVVWNSSGAFEISGNDVLVSRNGIVVNTCIGEVDDYGMIVNNFVYIEDLTCSESAMILTLSRYVKLMHNTLSNYDDCNSSNAALFIRGSDYVVKNNIINSRNSEAAISMGSYYFGSAMVNYDANYNMLSGSPIAIVGGDDHDLAGWQLFSGADASSFIETPDYIYSSELHLSSLPSIYGEAQTDVLFDIDGEARDLENPVIGADELPACIGALNGTYYIGDGEEFQSIKSAVNRLIACGIDASVDMRIKDGLYEEQINIYPIPGVSQENKIRFISDTENRDNVIIKHEEPQDHVVSFTHSRFITFEKMTIQAKGIGFDFKNGSMNNQIVDCSISVDSVFVSQEVSEALGNTPINMSGSLCDSNSIRNCSINYGLYGARLLTAYAERGHGNEFIGNHFQGQVYYGIYSKHFNGTSILNNTFKNDRNSDYTALFFQQSEDNRNINNNTIAIEGEGSKYGLFSTYSDIDTIANNFISLRTANADQEVVGIHLHNSEPAIIYNTISISGVTNENTKCTQVWISTLGVTLTNNLFDNSTNGYTRYDWGVASSDYNQYSANRELHIRYNNYFGGGQERDLFMFNYNNGQGDNSIEETASFIAYDDLHIAAPSILGNALSFDNILYDIDGDVRHDSIPDYGADEFGFSVQEEYNICSGDSIWIGANSGADSYLWNTGSDLAMIQVFPMINTSYDLTIIFELDTSYYTISVLVDAIELPNLEDELSICEGDTVSIYYPGSFDYWNWSTGSETDSTIIWEEGQYTISVGNGMCHAIDSVYVSVQENPIPYLGDDLSIYANETIVLSIDLVYENYLWNDGSEDEELSVSGVDFPIGENIFWVEVINSNGCIGRDSILVEVLVIDAIAEYENESLIVSPQPATFSLNISGVEMKKIEIKDISGAIVYSSFISRDQYSINISDWAKGVYLLQVLLIDDTIVTRKIIKV